MEQRDIRNLALIGFMGTGKSTAGQMAARFLGFEFLDTDQLIEERAGRTIPEIFEQAGETVFRELESQVIELVGQESGKVISTGGGVGANSDHVASLKKHSLVVCLWANPETIYRRVSAQGNRPLLECEDPKGRIHQLLEERSPFYRQADVLLSTELRPLRDVASLLCRHFREAQEECRNSKSAV